MRVVLNILFSVVILAAALGNACAQKVETDRTSLFDGTFKGWEGDTENTWRIENGTIIAGLMEKPAPRNEFLTTKARYSDFELTLEFKTTGTKKINAGVQFRTERIPDHHEVIGYQADIGDGYHGCLYDESRRRKVLARADKATDKKVAAAIPEDGWQKYRIRAVGNRIQLWLNGIQTVDYTEKDESIARDGVLALQIHGNMVGTIAYRKIFLKDLSKKSGPMTDHKIAIDDFGWIGGRWTGEALGGKFEETWNPPLGREMMGMFKLVKNDKVVFYELLTIVPDENGSFILRLKHFGERLVGWEEKDDSVEFPLESVSKTEVRFKGLKFTRKSETTTDRMVIEVVTKQGEKWKLWFSIAGGSSRGHFKTGSHCS